MHKYTPTYIHTYIYINIHTHVHTHTCLNTYSHTHRYAHIYINKHTYVHTHIYIHKYIHTHIYLHRYKHTYVSPYINIPDVISTDNIEDTLMAQNPEIGIGKRETIPKFAYETKRHTRNVVIEVSAQTRTLC